MTTLRMLSGGAAHGLVASLTAQFKNQGWAANSTGSVS